MVFRVRWACTRWSCTRRAVDLHDTARLGIESESKGGLRVTTPESMDVVRMVLTGQVSRELVGLLNAHGLHAVG